MEDTLEAQVLFMTVGSDGTASGAPELKGQEYVSASRPSVCTLERCSTHLSRTLQNEKYSTRKHLKVPENVTKVCGLCKNGGTPSCLTARILAAQNVREPCVSRAHVTT